MKNSRTLTAETVHHIGEDVTVYGWVHTKRDHSKVLFIDLRDRSGLLQVVTGSWLPESYAVLQTVGNEDVIGVTGKVVARPEKLINPDIPSGTVELQAMAVTILNRSAVPPFEVNASTSTVDEELRLKYRYLDLRSERMHKNVVHRAAVLKLVRSFLDDKHFTEIETPLLTASTPEGARDYIVPTRLGKGTFYALPQSPQQYKQLLMVGGIEQYYQIARCLRDEDSRGDRQPEFTQLDMEMSFVEQEDVMQLNEELLIKLVSTLYPEKTIQEMPFPRISYTDAMKAYGTDRPDMRTDKTNPNILAFCWVVDFPFFEKADDGSWTFTHNPFSKAKPEHEAWLMGKEHIEDILTTQYDICLNGYEIGGGSIRSHQAEALRTTFEIMGYGTERIDQHFGHMLTAFSYGAPPHGGIAWGFDRLMMLLENEPNIREVMAFPKTGEGRDPLMGAPGTVSPAQLKELHLEIK
jgi:aspartyl-tRNA synthetase